MPGYELIGNEEKNALNEIFDNSGGVLFAHGFDVRRNKIFRVRNFENNFAQAHGCSTAAACTSGSAAIYIALKCAGVQPGDQVITQSFTFIATVEAILACGAEPVIVDIDDTYNMDSALLENKITPKTKVIMPVHMLGNPASMDEINAIANKHNIKVIEDACEALGAKYRGSSTGTLGHSGVFSLDFGKTITCGEGGMIVSKDADFIKDCFQFVDHGHECRTDVPRGLDTARFYGFNFRMNEMQAAVGIEQLKKLELIVSANRRNKNIIKNILGESDKISFRRITDKDELADTIIFNFKSADLANSCVQSLTQNGLGTKNIPDANNWHFAKRWSHIWKSTPYYNDFENEWNSSEDLLLRSIALPITISMDEQGAMDYGRKVLKILNDL